MLRIVPQTVPRVGSSHKHFPDGFEFHLLLGLGRIDGVRVRKPRRGRGRGGDGEGVGVVGVRRTIDLGVLGLGAVLV